MGIVSVSHFLYHFSRKMFLMLNSINWTNFLVRLPLLLETLGHVFVTIICFPGCDIINFEINLVFLIKPFFYMTENSRKKIKYVENRKILRWNKKHFLSFLKSFQLCAFNEITYFWEEIKLIVIVFGQIK